jgi:uncharacterized protein (DUF1499 family)
MKKNLIALAAIPILIFVGMNWKLFVKAYDSQHMAAMQTTDLSCPDKPNCVSSKASGQNYIAPLDLGSEPLETIRKVYSKLGIKIISDNGTYLHAQATTMFYRFVDDVDLSLIPDKDGLYDIRSASRVGFKDQGVNRLRVQKIRSLALEFRAPTKPNKYNESH